MNASMPLATDFSARNTMTSTRSAKNPAAASVSHIGKFGERQIWSSDEAQSQFMRGVPQRSSSRIQRKLNAHPDALNLRRIFP
jgi:hypothetical protein